MSGAKADTEAVWRFPIPAPERARTERTRAVVGYLMLVGAGRRRASSSSGFGWTTSTLGSDVEVRHQMAWRMAAVRPVSPRDAQKKRKEESRRQEDTLRGDGRHTDEKDRTQIASQRNVTHMSMYVWTTEHCLKDWKILAAKDRKQTLSSIQISACLFSFVLCHSPGIAERSPDQDTARKLSPESRPETFPPFSPS